MPKGRRGGLADIPTRLLVEELTARGERLGVLTIPVAPYQHYRVAVDACEGYGAQAIEEMGPAHVLLISD